MKITKILKNKNNKETLECEEEEKIKILIGLQKIIY